MNPPRRKIARPEETIQRAIVQYLHLAHPLAVWFAVPNQKGTRTAVEMAILKGLGVKAGVSDLVGILGPDGRAWVMEVKSATGETSDDQDRFLEAAEKAGALSAVVHSLDAAIATFRRWGLPTR